MKPATHWIKKMKVVKFNNLINKIAFFFNLKTFRQSKHDLGHNNFFLYTLTWDKRRKEGNVLFNNAPNTFYVRLYDVGGGGGGGDKRCQL